MAVALILALVVIFIIGPIIVNIGLDKKQDWAGSLTATLEVVLLACTFIITDGLELSDKQGTYIFIASLFLYPIYVNFIFRYLIYVVLRFLIIKPIILLDSSMTAKIEQNKNAIKNNQRDQNNP